MTLYALLRFRKSWVLWLWSARFKLTASNSLPAFSFLSLAALTLTPPLISTASASYTQQVNAGGRAYTDTQGNQWSADQPYSPGRWGYIGGRTYSNRNIFSATDNPLYQSERYGNFTYRFDVPNGLYNVALQFAEIYWKRPGERIFDVFIEGQRLLNHYDICAAGGCSTALVRTFPGVQVRDGQLNIDFVTVKDNAKISAISISSSSNSSLKPVVENPATPPSSYIQRVRAGGEIYRDSKGYEWSADQAYRPGNWGYIGGRTYRTSKSIDNTTDDPLYQTERYGNFSYRFDVPNGSYNVTLDFAEIYWKKPGDRIFDVSIEGLKVLNRYDICAAVGCKKAAGLTFKGVQVRDRQLNIDFVTVRDNAKISAVSITGSVSSPPTVLTAPPVATAPPPKPVVSDPGLPSNGSPYPASPIISGISFDWSTHRRLSVGSDNWPITWADDDHQYTSWGDGGGFGGTNRDGRVSLGVARVEGSANHYQGFNVWGGNAPENEATFDGKSYGIISIRGVLYMWVSPGSDATSYEEARLYSSDDHGASWTVADWAFTKSEGLIFPTFLQFSRDYQGARDSYVHIYANHFNPADRGRNGLTIQKPGEIALLRAPERNLMNRNSYEFFAGLDANGNPIWTRSPSARKPVFTDSRGVGWNTSASFNPGLGRYLLMTEHDASFQGNLGVFDAPEPWGPWTTVLYANGFGSGAIDTNAFFWNFSNKWLSLDGKHFTLVFTGVESNDSWNTVMGTFMVPVGQ